MAQWPEEQTVTTIPGDRCAASARVASAVAARISSAWGQGGIHPIVRHLARSVTTTSLQKQGVARARREQMSPVATKSLHEQGVMTMRQAEQSAVATLGNRDATMMKQEGVAPRKQKEAAPREQEAAAPLKLEEAIPALCEDDCRPATNGTTLHAIVNVRLVPALRTACSTTQC